MAKTVSDRPDWLEAEGVTRVCSVSSCVSPDFADYTDHWAHNGFWLFNSPDDIRAIASKESIDLGSTELFFYRIHEREFDELAGRWDEIHPHPDFDTRVREPAQAELLGYDVACFSAGLSPECSPLSCNGLAKTIPTNGWCLLKSLEEAVQLLEEGRFDECEPGPYRIFEVSRVAWPE